nr:acyl-coenzyme A thioesterase 4-like [Pogona vitticeps]
MNYITQKASRFAAPCAACTLWTFAGCERKVPAERRGRGLLPRTGALLVGAGWPRMAARIRVLPSPTCLYDEPVRVTIEGLPPLREVTVRAWLEDESGERFQSTAYYRAGGQGELDLSRCAALAGGSYEGLEPMISCMLYNCSRLLGSCRSERWFLAEGVRRVAVREGRLRATLFLPPGPGPFPGLIDLYGSSGGLVEYRASLLASRGFVTLAVAYLAFEDLPALPEVIELDYFGEAVEFLQKQKQVKSTGIGVLGLSKGADLAIALATFSPAVRAAVCISGSGVNSFIPLQVKGLTIPLHPYDLRKCKTIGDSGILDFSEILDDPRDPSTWPCRIPVEKSLSKFLFLSGQDDRNLQSELFCREVVQRLRESGHHVEFCSYPGAGHLLEPPYLPLCQVSIYRPLQTPVLWGGEWREHAKAQEDVWQKILAFFRQHLSDPTIKSQL